MPMRTDPEQTPPAYTDFKPRRGWIRWTAAVLALAGWWLSLDLAKLSFGLAASTPWLQAECGADVDPSQSFDCQSVLSSSWGSLALSKRPSALRIPIATFGMGYFALVGLWYLFVGPPTRSRWAWHLLIAAIVVCGALVSLLMMHVMGNVLHRWCLGCIATHMLNGGLLLLTIVAFPWKRDHAEVAPHPRGRLALATLAACAFLFLLHPFATLVVLANNSAGRIYRAYTDIVDDPEYIRWQYERQPAQTLLGGDQSAHAGDPAAPNTVVVFVDYQCPVCKSACDMLKTVVQTHPGTLRVNYRHFPLDRSCNDGVPRSAHPAACRASLAAEAAQVAGGLDGFLRMRDLLYERLGELENAPYPQWAADLGLDGNAFSEALESERVARRIQEDIDLGRQLGVEAIPVLFLNGRRLHHWTKPETWEALLGLESAQDTGDSAAP